MSNSPDNPPEWVEEVCGSVMGAIATQNDLEDVSVLSRITEADHETWRFQACVLDLFVPISIILEIVSCDQVLVDSTGVYLDCWAGDHPVMVDLLFQIPESDKETPTTSGMN